MPAYAYIFYFRGTPLLVQMFLIYYGIGQYFADNPDVRAYLQDIGLVELLAQSLSLCAVDAVAQYRRLRGRDHPRRHHGNPARRDRGRRAPAVCHVC